jgi:formylglycine-generating enzyme required for sulfatase activity
MIIRILLTVCLFGGVSSLPMAAAANAAAAKATAAKAAAPKPGEVLRDCADCPEMVVIAAGSFQMGSTAEERKREGVPEIFGNREQPQHAVTIGKAFALGRTEVTVAQYARFSDDTKRPIDNKCAVFDRAKDNWALQTGSWREPGFKQADNEPVVCMSYNDARDYAAWLAKKTGKHYRLASEAEWEYAARGGTSTARYWGDSPRTLCENANVMSSATLADIGWPESWQDKLICAGRKAWTMPVGSFEANPFGLNDMYGGVWEWVADCAHGDYVGAPTDGSAWSSPNCEKFLVRGGAFHSEFWLARSATRGAGLLPNSHPVASGIRIARDID